ncbi:MAG: DUF481 domain-containing protein [Hyphomonadaceae bacterium]
MNLFRIAALSACIAAGATPALAQDDPASPWSGEGAFTAGVTTGNTETSDVGLALKLRHDGGDWIQSGEFAADYGETDSVETKNRMFAAGQIDRVFDERLSGYGRLTWERDEFSGFENRYFVGLGPAWKAIDSDAMKWTIEGGPGYKVDEIRATLTTPAETEESFSARRLEVRIQVQRRRQPLEQHRGRLLADFDADLEHHRTDREPVGQSQRPRLARRAARHRSAAGL